MKRKQHQEDDPTAAPTSGHGGASRPPMYDLGTNHLPYPPHVANLLSLSSQGQPPERFGVNQHLGPYAMPHSEMQGSLAANNLQGPPPSAHALHPRELVLNQTGVPQALNQHLLSRSGASVIRRIDNTVEQSDSMFDSNVPSVNNEAAAAAQQPVTDSNNKDVQGKKKRPKKVDAKKQTAELIEMIEDPGPLVIPRIIAVTPNECNLSAYQVLLRNQIEVFEAQEEHLTSKILYGNHKPKKVGQVGIRCRLCKDLPADEQMRGCMYFPATLINIYKVAQRMSSSHFKYGDCANMSPSLRKEFAETPVQRSESGKFYWAAAARKIGLIDTPDGIFFDPDSKNEEGTKSERKK